jgi:hypothetical protein
MYFSGGDRSLREPLRVKPSFPSLIRRAPTVRESTPTVHRTCAYYPHVLQAHCIAFLTISLNGRPCNGGVWLGTL